MTNEEILQWYSHNPDMAADVIVESRILPVGTNADAFTAEEAIEFYKIIASRCHVMVYSLEREITESYNQFDI